MLGFVVQAEGNHDESRLQHEHRGNIQGKHISGEYGYGIAVILIMVDDEGDISHHKLRYID